MKEKLNSNDNKIYRSVKIRLLPTKEQEVLFWKSVGVARWSYNYFLSESYRVYQEWLEDNSKPKYISEQEVRKYINNHLKKTTHTWLKEVSSNVMKQGVKDANIALQNFFRHNKGYPKFKSKKRSIPSFYVNYESLKRTLNGFQGEKIGVVKTRESLPKIGKNQKYINPRISFDGMFWYLSLGYKVKMIDVSLSDTRFGIDLGIKELAVVSNQDGTDVKKYHNINKTYEVKRLEKKLKREKRKFSRKILINKCQRSDNKLIPKKDLESCKNIQKQKGIIQRLYRRLLNIRTNYLHQTTTEIVKNKPSCIVLEDLNVSGMMKNRHLSRSIMVQKLYEFRRQIEYKAELYGIEVVIADRFYPSSKTCSCCGNIKKDLKLSNRVYRCDYCGNVIDRDVNASINLANYNIESVN
nr:MAG TPA: endonuclease [Caudoviricetes sp.]